MLYLTLNSKSGFIMSKWVFFHILYGFLTFLSVPTTGQDNDDWVPDESQKPEKGFDWNKVYAGGGLALQFGSYTFIDVSPILGYRLTDDVSTGFGISYKYLSDNRVAGYNSHLYGGNIFARYAFAENFFGHIEYELLNVEYFTLTSSGTIIDSERKDISYLWIGGGYRQPIGLNSYLNLMVLYNLNESIYSIYPNPVYRIGFNVGL